MSKYSLTNINGIIRTEREKPKRKIPTINIIFEYSGYECPKDNIIKLKASKTPIKV